MKCLRSKKRKKSPATTTEDVHPSGSGATRAPRNNGISISNMEAVAGPAIPALCSAATGGVGSNGTPLLPQRRERHNAILGEKTGASLPVGESGRSRTKGV